MARNYAQNSAAGSLSTLKPISLTLLLTSWSASRWRAVLDDWLFWARRDQLPPPGAFVAR